MYARIPSTTTVSLTLVAHGVADSIPRTKALGSREKSAALPSTGPILQQLGSTAGQTAHTTAESAPPATNQTASPTPTQQPSDRGCSCTRSQPLPRSRPHTPGQWATACPMTSRPSAQPRHAPVRSRRYVGVTKQSAKLPHSGPVIVAAHAPEPTCNRCERQLSHPRACRDTRPVR